MFVGGGRKSGLICYVFKAWDAGKSFEPATAKQVCFIAVTEVEVRGGDGKMS